MSVEDLGSLADLREGGGGGVQGAARIIKLSKLLGAFRGCRWGEEGYLVCPFEWKRLVMYGTAGIEGPVVGRFGFGRWMER